jgi:hypothetical protein
MSLKEALPFLIPILLIQLGLIIFALRDLFQPGRRVKGGNKIVWALVIVFINLLGPLIYFLVGREEA